MTSAVSRAPRPGLFRAIAQVVDWRLVAAIGLPIWAFVLGIVVMHKPASATPTPVEPPETVAKTPAPQPPAPQPPAPQPAPAPAPTTEALRNPHEAAARTTFQTVPVVVPILPRAEPVAATIAPAEFRLPASEVMPADRCKTFDTKIRFHPDVTAAADEAKTSKKMLLVLHISGNFDDPGFT
jgi:hypothetical protein